MAGKSLFLTERVVFFECPLHGAGPNDYKINNRLSVLKRFQPGDMKSENLQKKSFYESSAEDSLGRTTHVESM